MKQPHECAKFSIQVDAVELIDRATPTLIHTVKGLSNLISAAAIEAKIEGRTAHGLRKYRLSAIAEAGGSAHAIMAWGGHASLSEAEAYTRAASRKAIVTGVEQEQNAVNDIPDASKQHR